MYIREAHPGDEWQMESNDQEGIVYDQPRTLSERRGIASACCSALKLTMPCVVDDERDTVDNAYAAWPERIFIVGADGKIAYAGEQGPWGFKTRPVEKWLKKQTGHPGRT